MYANFALLCYVDRTGEEMESMQRRTHPKKKLLYTLVILCKVQNRSKEKLRRRSRGRQPEEAINPPHEKWDEAGAATALLSYSVPAGARSPARARARDKRV
jgi:hypothetical protein